MSDGEPYLKGAIRELLERYLSALMQEHIPDDERHGILSSAYWIRYTPSHETFGDIDHELPVLQRSLGGDGQQEIMLGRDGGVLVATRIGDVLSVGTWTHGEFAEETQIAPDPPDS